MQLRIKPLRGGEFVLNEVSLQNTVKEIKELIEKEKGDAFPADLQKLIHATKIMDNDKTLADYKVKEKSDFLVCMVSKKKKKTAAAATTSSAAATTTTTPPVASTPAPAANTRSPAPATTPTPSTAAQPAAPAGITISDEAVNNLMELGFDEPTVRTALQVAFGNAETAAAYLFDPALLLAARQAQESQSSAGANSPSAGSGNRLDQFRNHPDFNELRRLVQGQPESMNMVLQQIQRSDPALYQTINENMDEFVRMMNEPIEDASGGPAGLGGLGNIPGLTSDGQLTPESIQGMMQMMQMMQQMSPEERAVIAQRMGLDAAHLEMITNAMQRLPPEQLQQMFEQGLGAMGGGGMPGGLGGALPGMDGAQPPAVQLTDEDAEAVARLEAMGFPRHMVLQAYFGCDKNEQLAANFLANMSDDEDNNS